MIYQISKKIDVGLSSPDQIDFKTQNSNIETYLIRGLSHKGKRNNYPGRYRIPNMLAPTNIYTK